MRLIDFLETTNSFCGELVCAWDGECSLDWDNTYEFTAKGKKRFANILMAEVKDIYQNGYGLCVLIDEKDITEQDFQNFLWIMAGYRISETEYRTLVRMKVRT